VIPIDHQARRIGTGSLADIKLENSQPLWIDGTSSFELIEQPMVSIIEEWFSLVAGFGCSCYPCDGGGSPKTC